MTAVHPVIALRRNGSTPFAVAIMTGNLSGLARALARGGAGVNDVDADGHTPLMTAIAHDRPAVVEFLLERGADVNAATANGYTALHFAAACGQSQVIDMLVNAGGDIYAENHCRITPWDLMQTTLGAQRDASR